MGHRVTAEEQAQAALEASRVPRVWGIILVAVFLGTVAFVPLWEHVRMGIGEAWPVVYEIGELFPGKEEIASARGWRDVAALVPAPDEIEAHEDAVEEASFLRELILPRAQLALTRLLGAGNEQVYPGRDGWLFYRPGVDHLIAPPFDMSERAEVDPQAQPIRLASAGTDVLTVSDTPSDPLSTIHHLHRQLERRDIALIVVPVPVKAQVHPEYLSASYAARRQPVRNPAHEELIIALQRRGVNVYDPLSDLFALKGDRTQPVYLKTDTHWRPEAMELVAQKLAHRIQLLDAFSEGTSIASGSKDLDMDRSSSAVTALGDIATMLRLPEPEALYPPQSVETHPVTLRRPSSDAEDGVIRRDANVLLMGDSFTNIYSMKELGWGENAGMAEQLAWYLGTPVDRIAINAGGAYSTRKALVDELRRGYPRLAGKRVVVWQFAARELTEGRWDPLVLPAAVSEHADAGSRSAASPEVPPADADEERPAAEEPVADTPEDPPDTDSTEEAPAEDEATSIRAKVVAATRPPRPGSVPYRDCLVALQLQKDASGADGGVPEDFVIYAWGMRDNQWTPVAEIDEGDVVELQVVPWMEVASEYGSFNRRELESADAFLLETYWAPVLREIDDDR